jgi:Ni/Fe-hydrogenase subunit HybB-like protein
MSSFSVGRVEAGLGRPLARAALVLVATGALGLVAGVAAGRAGAALAGLTAAWLFFAGLSAGGIAFTAVVRIVHGRWAAPLMPLAQATAGFFVPALGLLAILLLGARAFVPGLAEAGLGRHALLALRLLGGSAVLFALGRRLVAGEQAGEPDGRLRAWAIGYVVAYAVVLTIWTFDLVLALSSAPPQAVVPAYYFLGAFLSGLAFVGLVAALRDVSGPDLRHDFGKLLFAFIVVWSYLLWSLFLPTWYGNIPEENELLLARWRAPYKAISIFVLIAVGAWPFWLLFTEKLKRRRATLALGAGTVLVGLCCERFLLVLPSLHLRGDLPALLVGAAVALGTAGFFLLGVGARLPASPP